MSALCSQRGADVSPLKGLSGSIHFRREWGWGNWGLSSARQPLLIAVNHEIGLYHLMQRRHKDRYLPSPDLWVELQKKKAQNNHILDITHSPSFSKSRIRHVHESTSFRGIARKFWYLGIPSSGTAAVKRNDLPLSLEHQHCEGFSAEEWLCYKFTTV